MCVVSAIGDGYKKTFPDRWPQFPVYPWAPSPTPALPYPFEPLPNAPVGPYSDKTVPFEFVPKSDFDALKREVEELRRLLEAAKRFDEQTGQPGCEMDDKVDFIKKLAKMVGVDMNEVFPEKA